jgi:hypothetical protein
MRFLTTAVLFVFAALEMSVLLAIFAFVCLFADLATIVEDDDADI